MDQHNATPDTEPSSVGRRTVLKGAAWSVPVVAVVGATPAFAKTGDTVTFTSVVVNPAPTGAPSNYYINISNQNSTVTVGGSVTSGAVVTVTATGGYSATATTTGTSWTHTITASLLPQGTVSFTASVAGPPVVSDPGPHQVVKDTLAPTITGTPTVSYSGASTKIVSFSGTMSEPGTVYVTWSTFSATITTSGPTNAWSGSWTNVNNNVTSTFSATPTDSAGNPGTAYTQTFKS